MNNTLRSMILFVPKSSNLKCFNIMGVIYFLLNCHQLLGQWYFFIWSLSYWYKTTKSSRKKVLPARHTFWSPSKSNHLFIGTSSFSIFRDTSGRKFENYFFLGGKEIMTNFKNIHELEPNHFLYFGDPDPQKKN